MDGVFAATCHDLLRKTRLYAKRGSCIKRNPIDTASRFDGAFGADSGRSVPFNGRLPMPVVQALAVFLLMSVLAQALLALVRGDLVTFAFFSARHK